MCIAASATGIRARPASSCNSASRSNLKAFLLLHGWELKKIHVLYTLLDDAVGHTKELNAFYDLCERVSGYYYAERYPPVTVPGLTCKDVAADLEAAGAFIRAMFPDESPSA